MQEFFIYESENDSRQTPEIALNKRNVCGYARVSTQKEEQAESCESQICYYREMIEANPDYNFVGIYTDT